MFLRYNKINSNNVLIQNYYTLLPNRVTQNAVERRKKTHLY